MNNTASISKLTLLIIFCSVLLNCGGNESASQVDESSSTSTSSTATLTQALDTYLAGHQKDDEAGISVLVVKNGEAIYASKGMARKDSRILISKTTGFQLASISKPFTAIAIMQLVEKGELKLSDSILQFIPELPPTWNKITIEHLLMHRSGVIDIINDFWNPTLLSGLTNNSLIPYLIQNPTLEFEPGTNGDYSNTGFMLLAIVIERKTGMSFPAYMAQHIFGPANMQNSYITDENQSIKVSDALNYASKNTYYGFTTYLKGSMGQVSSTEDFFNFFSALKKGILISSETLANMTRSHSKIANAYDCGYGFFVNKNTFGHSGEWDGFEAELMINYASDTQLIVLTNSGKPGRSQIDEVKKIVGINY